MKINEHTAIVTPRVLLVPYCTHHVPTYHTWMQDETLQTLTASEPLSLEAEHAMQQSWRTDPDKLTFIICISPLHSSPPNSPAPNHHPSTLPSLTPGTQDAPEFMLGDVNLFLYPDDDDDDDDADDDDEEQSREGQRADKKVLGELEIMLASPSHRGKGLARESLRAFLSYISSNLTNILCEYANGDAARGLKLTYLRAKINEENVRSVKLFEGLGFKMVGGGANYFGEVELRLGREEIEGGERLGVEVEYRISCPS